ncbi:MAG: hypothetical protein M5U34_32125 [Chloroflexi bacterium]|nr:hypothetical protein [Chloroflexota bacterium]
MRQHMTADFTQRQQILSQHPQFSHPTRRRPLILLAMGGAVAPAFPPVPPKPQPLLSPTG